MHVNRFGLKCEMNDINGIQKMIYELMKKNGKKQQRQQ